MNNFNIYPLGRGNNGKHIEIGNIEIFVSYQTVIAYRTPEDGLVARENDWSSTTGQHMAAIPGNYKEDRISGALFDEKFNKMLEDHGL